MRLAKTEEDVFLQKLLAAFVIYGSLEEDRCGGITGGALRRTIKMEYGLHPLGPFQQPKCFPLAEGASASRTDG